MKVLRPRRSTLSKNYNNTEIRNVFTLEICPFFEILLKNRSILLKKLLNAGFRSSFVQSVFGSNF
jgi:hypothetical protein